MRTISKSITTIIFAFLALMANGFPSGTDSLRFEVLMNRKMLDDIKLNVNFINSFSITSNRLILLSTDTQFYALGWGGIVPLGSKVQPGLNCFAFTPDNYLMAVSKNDICTFDSVGNISRRIKVPNEGMGLSAGKYVMYVYDQDKNKPGNALYIVAKGGKYSKLFEITNPLTSVIEFDNSILFSSGSALFRFNPKNKELKLFVALPNDKLIKSIALDTTSNRLYFSTDNEVYSLRDSRAVIISDQFGGKLRYFNDGLLVFNAEKKFLMRITGMEDKIAAQPVKSTAVEKMKQNALGNATIVSMVKSSLSDNLIIDLINRSEVNFNVSVDSMIFLSGQNVSSAVILAMKNAMKRKNGNDINVNNSVINSSTDIQSTQNIPSDPGKPVLMKYYIIAGSYPSEKQATDAVAGLKSNGFPDATIVGKNGSGGYRIAYSGFSSNKDASAGLTKIKQTINPAAWILEIK